MGNCIAPSTRAAYKQAQQRYAAFCMRFGVATPYPLLDDTLCRYVAFLTKEGIKHQTIKSYLSGIRCLQIQLGLGNPFAITLPRLECVLLGIKRVEVRGGNATHTRLPFTIDILQCLYEVWLGQPVWVEGVMIWAAACIEFFGFLRAGEFTVPSAEAYDPDMHLNLSDIALDSHTSPSVVRVSIKQSKTDLFCQGVDIVGQDRQYAQFTH